MIICTYTSSSLKNSVGGSNGVAKMVIDFFKHKYSTVSFCKFDANSKIFKMLKYRFKNKVVLINHSPHECGFLKIIIHRLLFSKVYHVVHSEPDYLIRHILFEKRHCSPYLLTLLNLKLNIQLYLKYIVLFIFNTKIILISNTHLSYFESRFRFKFLPSSKCIVIKNPISIERTEKISPLKERTKLVFVGRLVSIKRVTFLVKAWSLISNDFKNFEFNIIGDGPEYSLIKDFIESHGYERVNLLGFQSDIKSFLDSSSFMLMASAYEGTPQSIVEAQARGVIPICLNSFSAAHEMIIHGYNGFVIEATNVLDFSKEIKLIIEKSNLYSISQNCVDSIIPSELEVIEMKWLNLVDYHETL
jgi:glycosyltransferase involved in cell wall biosynthesis